jgi:transcriptional regulator with XRE-family HTH domain
LTEKEVYDVSEISELLKKIRGKDSLREASKKTGISHNYISIIEKGVDPRTGTPINITPDTLKAYSKGYHYDYEELMKVAGHLKREVNEKQTEYDPLQASKNKLIDYLKDVKDPELIESLTNIAKNIVNNRDR